MATPFSKNNLGATPTQFTSSPHPSAVPMGRPLSHKSPFMRTPSATGPGHQNHPSVSSYQNPTPLPATTATLDDAVMFSSPSAALLALGLGGITPSPAGNDALGGGQEMNEGGMHPMAMPPMSMTGPKDIDEERRKRIDEVVQLLRTRVAGRGVCREGIERLGRLEGLECMWQDNNLSIAGNSVDLEIEFEPGQETVRDVTLRYATPDAPEGERRVEASEVLKRNLEQAPGEQRQGCWKSMANFHENLRRLARLDQLSREINCFEAVEGIHECLHRISEEEKKDSVRQSCWNHMCKGWVGKPSMHRGKDFGLVLEYWAEQRHLLKAKQSSSENAMDFDPSARDEDKEPPTNANIWGAFIECETGYPPLRVSKDWVAADIFTTISDADAADDSSDVKIINWTEPPPTLVSPLSNNPESVALEPTILSSTTPNMRFVARLEPPVDMPMFAASEIYRVLGANLMQDYKPVTYDSLVIPSQADGFDYAELEGKQPLHKREISTFDAHGKPMKCQHTYTFNTFEPVPGRTIRDLPFSHPRQIIEVLPILRQFAFLSSLLRRIFATPKQESINDSSSKQPGPGLFRESRPDGHSLSNINPTERRLDDILKNGASYTFNTTPSTSSTCLNKDMRVDVSLRTPMSFSPSILLVFSVNEELITGNPASSAATSLKSSTPRQVMINIDIGLNGDISVSQISGLWSGGDDDVDDERDAAKMRLCAQIAKVLEVCEDFGMLVEWILRWMRKNNKA